MIYAGIGARKTPDKVLNVMTAIGMTHAGYGFTLRSGGAKGADEAFEHGARIMNGGKVESFSAEDSERNPEWIDHAAKFHPNWSSCSAIAMQLHARNSAILLGENLDKPVDFVVCWTNGGLVIGGTGQALRIAKAYNIPVFNLYHDPEAKQLFDTVAWMVKNAK